MAAMAVMPPDGSARTSATGAGATAGRPMEIFTSIYYGRPKGMPAFGGALGPEGVWTLVTYLKSLPVPANEPTESFEKP